VKQIVLCLLGGALCLASDWEAQVRALRPADTKKLEAAVLDDLERGAHDALAAIVHARTPQEAAKARPMLRRQLEQSLGFRLLPWPPDLRARTVGTVARAGYRIEKIVYQTLPGVWVPAHLYLPDPVRAPAPAILFYNGHWWPDSKTRPDFQAFCINMARWGFVVLTFDPFGQGERGISSRDHRRTEALLVGVAQQGIAEYETRCALEYVLSRREIDPKRVGMTGASGGGYNTWINAALDDRIAVAVPVVGTSEFYEQISVTRALDWYHASEHCHFVPGLIRYANNHELLAMISPRPLMIIAASKDQSFPVEGVRSVSAYGRQLYSAYGSAEKIGFFEDSSEGHGYQRKKREAAYGWFLRWLIERGDGSAQPEPATETEPYDSSELRCFEENRPAGPGVVDMVKRLAAGLPPGEPRQPLRTFPSLTPVVNLAGTRLQRLSLGLTSGFLLRPPAKATGVLIALDDRGKEAVISDLPVDELLDRGWAIYGVDPRGIGESATTQMGWAAAVSLLLGENFVMRQGDDLYRTRLMFSAPVAVYARGPNATLAATYAALDDSRLVLRGGFQSFRQFFDRPKSLALSFQLRKEDKDRTTAFDREIPFAYVPFAALRSYDLPQLRRADRTLVIDPINGDWEPEGAAMRDPAAKIIEFLGRPR
jgi:dienelactone hydrolase